jgi:hypothetical protein
MLPVYNTDGACVGLTIDSTVYSEAALLTLLSRLQRAEGDRERLAARVETQDGIIADLRAQVTGLLELLDTPRVPRMDDVDRASVARLSG